MKLLILTRPGEKHGHCEQCRHDECADQRELASSVCHCCQNLIGFHRAFCFDAELNISESTISELMNAGELSRVKIGVRVLFTPQMLTNLINRKTILTKWDRLKAVS